MTVNEAKNERDLFVHVGPISDRDEAQYGHVSFWQDGLRRFFSSKATILCLLALLATFLGCIIVPTAHPAAISGINAAAINAQPGRE